jgi:hypothetical protein
MNTYPKKLLKEALKFVPKDMLKKAKDLHKNRYGK